MPDRIPTTEQNVASLMAAVASQHADKPALVFESKGKCDSISFGRLWDEASAIAINLQALGLAPGDRVIVMIPMSIDLYVCLLGIIRMGAVVVFVDPWIGARQIARFSEFAEPTAFIGINKSHLLRWSSGPLRKIRISVTNGYRFGPFLARHSLSTLKRATSTTPVAAVTPDQTALITFTSGSSGTPKGANRTHRFLLSQHLALKQEFPYQVDDVDMAMFPVFALNNLVTGITSIVPEMDFRIVAEVDGQRILEQIVQHRVTTCTASPPLLDNLAEAVGVASDKVKSQFRLRRVLTGGAPVSDEQLATWCRKFHTPEGATEIIVAYGSTEAEPVGHIHAQERLSVSSIGKGFCTGRPTDLIRRLVVPIVKGPIDLSTQSIDQIALPPGEIGELVVAGDHVCRDYYENKSATDENKIVDEHGTVWHRMGDTGYFDEQGRFWLVGRVHSTIIRNGLSVHPQIIEQIAKSACSQAVQVAAIGYDHPELGQMVVVLIGLNTPINELDEEVKQQVRTGMQKLNQPCDCVVVTHSKLPVDPRHNSKIDYVKARTLLPSSLVPDSAEAL